MLRKALIFIGLAIPLFLGAQVSEEHESLLKEANALFEEASYVTAQPLFSQLVSLYPKNADLNFKFGACALYNGDKKSTSIRHLTYATKKGAEPRSFYHLGRAFHLNYEFEEAKESYQDFQRKADPEVSANFDADRQIAMCEYGVTLLSSITDLVVMDKQETSDQDFFRYFDMENVGGKILIAPEELQSKADKKRNHQSIIHFPGDKSIIYFSSYGKDGSNGLDIYQATRLSDGTFIDVKPIGGGVNTPYDENFPYFHPDGKTLYFASKGHNSMGGFDIFKSTLNTAGQFGVPENMDFAINTPDDDIFYITDSLNNSAWFASGRSSAQGNLHVYNVLVQGLPSALIYLDGMFVSEIDSENQKAQIVVTDELTDRPVMEIFSNSFNGDYLLSLPKSGLYRFAVMVEGSPIRHEGLVEIPVFDQSVALRQELRLVDVDGQQKLIIQNFFDEPLDMDLASLAQDALRAKASLDVNATDELIAEAQAQAKDDGPSLTIEKNLDNATLAAGFTEGVTIDDVVANGRKDVQSILAEVQKIEKNADLAYSYAEDLRKSADQKLNAAESKMTDIYEDNTPAYIAALREFSQLVEEAGVMSEESFVALETADRAMDFAKLEKQKASELSANFNKIEAAIVDSDFDSVVWGLRQEKDRLKLEATEANRDPKANALALADMKEDEGQRILERVSQLRDVEKLLIKDKRRLEISLEKTTKKSARSKIENEIVQVREELTITQQNILNEDTKANDLGNAEKLFRQEAEFYDLLVGDNQQFGLPEERIKSFDAHQKELLKAEIESTKIRAEILSIEDEETLALLDEKSRLTRIEATKLASIQDKAIEKKITLKSMPEIRKGYESQLLTSNSMDSITSSYREKVLADKTIEEIDEHLTLYDEVRGDFNDVEKIATIDQEIQSLQSLRNDLLTSSLISEASSRSYTPDEIRGAYSAVYTDYQDETSRIVNQDTPELDKSLDLQVLKKTTRDLLSQAVANNESIIINSSDGVTVAGLMAQNDLYKQAIDQLTEVINTIDQFKAAYETETKDIIESEEAVIERLHEQIELTQSYISMLGQLTTETQSELDSDTDGGSTRELTEMLKAIQGERDAAVLKLDTYEVDLSLTLSADNQPVADVSSIEVVLSSLTPIELASISPDYNVDWAAVEGRYPTIIERNRAKIKLNEGLILGVDAAIEERVSVIDEIADDEVKDQLQIEIQQLESLRSEKLVLNDKLENQISDLDNLESHTYPEVSPEIDLALSAAPTEITPEIEADFVDIFQRPKAKDPTEIYESELLDEMLVVNEDPDLMIRNRSEIYVLQQEIAIMEADLIGASDSKQRKLDRQIEKKYQKLADEELKNARIIEQLSEVSYNSNMARISTLSAVMSETVNENDWLMKEVEYFLNKANSDRDEATATRKKAAPEIDEIKQNYLLREAFLFDQTAIEYQEKVIAIYENAVLLSNQDEEYLATLKSGEISAKEQLEDNSSVDEVDSEALVGVDATTVSGNKRSEPLENRIVALADVINRNRLRELIAIDHNFSEEEMAELESKPELVNYLRGVSDLGSLESERSILINQRNELAREVVTIEQRIGLLSSALDVSEEESIRAGLEAELETVVANAQVLYKKVDDKEHEIHLKTQKVFDLGERLRISFDEIDLDGLATEINAEESLAINEETITDPDTSVEADLNSTESEENDITVDPVVEEVLPDPFAEGVIPTTSATRPLMPSTAGDFRDFESPEFLSEEIFVRLDGAVYSESNPIPVDVTMPRGVVYKVQVGAFRNLIPQDHFDEFAPMAAEKLNNGITRYTAGLFPSFEGADDAKVDIRGMGYSDAFVVAFRDGVRISLTDAKSATGEELIVSNDGPVIKNVDPAPATNSNASGTTSDATTPATASNSITNESATAEDARDYYNSFTDAAEATQVEALSGLFYTVQVGVYSKPVPSKDLFHINPLNSELIDKGRIRYSSGRYNSLIDASVRKAEIRAMGINDAFVTAYYNGKRIGVAGASSVLQNEGVDELEINNTLEDSPFPASNLSFDVYIGSFENEVPAETARAMLFLEEEWGVFQISEGSKTTYFTGRISSVDQAQSAAAAFEEYGVSNIRIRAFEDDVEVPFSD